jgi:DNA-directed RNA polymerase subunit RPC12/RpoP
MWNDFLFLSLVLFAILICPLLLFFLINFLLIVAFKLGGNCSECGSRIVWVWRSRSPDFSHGERYAHRFKFRKCLRCGRKEIIEHSGGYYDHWIPPASDK